MSFVGRQNHGLQELRDGSRLARDINNDTEQSMIRLSKDCFSFLHEATDLGPRGWVYPVKWFENNSLIHGEGFVMRRYPQHFEMSTEQITFPVSHIVRSSICLQIRVIPIRERSKSICFGSSNASVP
jgi:hypothetical protein